MNVRGGIIRMTAGQKERIALLADAGCPCGAEECQLTRRRIGSAVTVHLQCLGCGRSMGGGLPRAEHFFFQDYPEWDQALRDRYVAGEDERYAALADERDEAWREQRDAYADWLEASPEWRSIRARVLRRSGGLCEACLDAPAVQVHHQTYAKGWVPPAWELRAVCQSCHRRLHAGWRGSQ